MSGKSSVYVEYFTKQLEFQQKYGERTVVLIQIGDFYEIFEYDPTEDREDEDLDSKWVSIFEEEFRKKKHNVFKLDEKEQLKRYIPKRRQKIGYTSEIAKILGFEFAKVRKKDPHSVKNPFRCGFPIGAYRSDKKANNQKDECVRTKLLQENWHIVVIAQKDEGGKRNKKEITRYVLEIVTPSTDEISAVNCNKINNFIVSIFLEVQEYNKKLMNYTLLCGVSALDTITGYSEVAEFYSQDKNPGSVIKELYRYLLSKRPREVIFAIKDVPKECQTKYTEFLSHQLKLFEYPIVIWRYDEFPPDFFKIAYHRTQLEYVFGDDIKDKCKSPAFQKPKKYSTSIISELDLERMNYGRLSFINIINYVYEHEPKVLSSIQQPNINWFDKDEHLILTYNSIVQANIYPENKMFHRFTPLKKEKNFTSIFEVLNNTSTKMGERNLQRLLYNPLTDCEKLNKYYNMTEEMIADSYWKTVETNLKGMADIDRFQRLLSLQNIKPKEFSRLFQSYAKIVNIIESIGDKRIYIRSNIPKKEVQEQFNYCLRRVFGDINLEALSDCTIDAKNKTISYLYYPLKKKAQDFLENQKLRDELNEMVSQLIQYVPEENTRDMQLKFDDNRGGKRGEDGTGLINTAMGFICGKNRGKRLLKRIPSTADFEKRFGHLEIKPMKTGCLVTSSAIEKKCVKYNELKDKLEAELYEEYRKLVIDISIEYDFFRDISDFVSMIDLVKSHAKCAIKYKYYRPEIDSRDGPSYFTCENLRHPLVERINSQEYIPNNIAIGRNVSYDDEAREDVKRMYNIKDISGKSGEADDINPKGILLYGANQVGKSTLAKSIGVAVIMAQIGCFTPGQLKFRPYHKIITRLTGNDSLIEGKSSFVVELSELLEVEKASDDKTLIIGDELCKGTETPSATSITVAIIELLLEENSSFIFSTHMHHLVDMEEIRQIPQGDLRICHLHIYYDVKTETLVYERKLKAGPGDANYGIETAKYIGFSQKFIERAMQIRRSYLKQNQQIISGRKSKYNAKKYVDRCELCGSENAEELETHHIKEQHKSGEDGFIEHVPKNAEYNLMVLCRKCHHYRLHGEGNKIQVDQTLGGKIVRVVPE